jgi:thiamine biosynthesis protein ThiS
MQLIINGEPRDFDGPLSLAGLVDRLGMKQDRVAVELNRDIVTRDKWSDTTLTSGDQLEIVHFVGGGSSAQAATLTCTVARGGFSSSHTPE